MAGTRIGGVKASQTNKRLYGADFYKRIGGEGGRNGHTGGFYANRELARKAGEKGGRISKRKKVIKVEPHPLAGTVTEHRRVPTYHFPATNPTQLDDIMIESKKPSLISRIFKRGK